MSSEARAPVLVIDDALIEQTKERAASSSRLRTNHNFHASLDDEVHRFLNVMCRGTYVTPHRHLDPPKSETFMVLSGEVGVLIFDEEGAVTQAHHLGREKRGVDLLPGVIHSLVVLTEQAVIFEVKSGPYAPATDKSFMPFAPREGDARAPEYLRFMLTHFSR